MVVSHSATWAIWVLHTWSAICMACMHEVAREVYLYLYLYYILCYIYSTYVMSYICMFEFYIGSRVSPHSTWDGEEEWFSLLPFLLGVRGAPIPSNPNLSLSVFFFLFFWERWIVKEKTYTFGRIKSSFSFPSKYIEN